LIAPMMFGKVSIFFKCIEHLVQIKKAQSQLTKIR